jgi:hypothetical protein
MKRLQKHVTKLLKKLHIKPQIYPFEVLNLSFEKKTYTPLGLHPFPSLGVIWVVSFFA